MVTQKSKNILHKPYVLYTLVILVVCAFALGAWWVFGRADKTGTQNNPSTGVSEGELSPATAEEKAQAETHKKELANERTPAPPSTDSPTKVTPLITYAGQTNNTIEVIAFTPGISQDGGTCKVVIAQAGQSVTKTVPANRNTSTTDCQKFTFDRSEFKTPGEWSAVVSYSSPTATGSSDEYKISIP